MKKLFLIPLILILCLNISFAEESDNTIYIYPSQNISEIVSGLSNKTNVVLKSGVHEVYQTINVNSNVTISGEGEGTLIKNLTGENLFQINGSYGVETFLTEKLQTGHFAGTYYFKVKVSDVTGFKAGDTVMIYDDLYSEFNTIQSVDADIWLINRPSNNYELSRNAKIKVVDLKSNIKIDNFKITQSGSGNAFLIDASKNVDISNVFIEGTKTSGHGILVQNAELVNIHKNKITEGINAVRITHQSRMVNVSENKMFNAWTGIGLGGNNNLIHNNTIVGSGTNRGSGDGITVFGYASKNIISDNLIDSGDCYGLWVTGTYPTNNMISNNTIRSNITTGIMISKGEGHNIIGNVLENNTHGISVDGSIETVKNIVISSNVATDQVSSGIIVYNAKNVIVSSNNCYNNGKTTSVYATDIVVAFSKNVKVFGNITSKMILDRLNVGGVEISNNILTN